MPNQPSVTWITGTCVPALRGPGRGRSAQLDLSGVQKGQIAHLGRQKPPESELAVAAHGGASQRHTTGAVYGRLRTSWDGDGPCGLNLSVGGHTVQNKTKQNLNRQCLVVHLTRRRMKDGLLKTRDHSGSNASPLAGFERLESGEDTSNNGQEGAAWRMDPLL